MKPEFKIRKQRGKFAIEYLHVTKRFLLPDKKEWRPYIHYSGTDRLYWFDSIDDLKVNLLFEVLKQ